MPTPPTRRALIVTATACVVVMFALAAPAMAQEHGAEPAGKNVFQYLGAAFAIGIAAGIDAKAAEIAFHAPEVGLQ